MKQDCRKVQEIQTGLNDLGMADRNIDSTAQLFSVPGFTPVSWNAGPQDRRPYSLSAKQLFQPFDNVVLIGVNRKDLALAAACELGFHFLDECPLLGIRLVLVQVNRFGNDKRIAAFGFWVEFRPVQSAESIRMVRPGQQSVEHGARNAAVSAMLLQAGSDLLFELLISRLQWLFHRHWYDFLPIAWQTVRDVLQPDESAMVHQILAEQQRRGAGLALDRDRLLGFPGAGVVFDCDAFDSLDHAEVACEAFPPG